MTNRIFRDAGIVLFEGKIIYNAQPPITDDEIARVERLVGGKLPHDLIDFWKLCYGGDVNYDLFVTYGTHIHPFSFGELFYPGSKRYHDLDGWIEHEQRLWDEEKQQGNIDKTSKLDVVPIGGFEYLDRLYVSIKKENCGAVYAYSEGIPPAWPLRLHENSFARVADNLRQLFDQMFLEEDPERADPERFPTGLDALEAIEIAECDGNLSKEQVAQLRAILQGDVLDWRLSLKDGTINKDYRQVLLALLKVAEAGDVALLNELEAQGIDIFQPLTGSGTLLDHALTQEQYGLAGDLLDRGMPVSDQTLQCLQPGCDKDLRERLVQEGARPNEHVVLHAARNGDAEFAKRSAQELAAHAPASVRSLLTNCLDCLRSNHVSVERIEKKELFSNISIETYREETERLQEFADWLRSEFS